MIPTNFTISKKYNKDLSNSQKYSSLPRFRWYGYKEGFSPQLVEEAIKKVGIKDNEFILDPFNGNGTVTLTASLNEFKSLGFEVNPFVSFMSKVKQSNIEVSSFKNDIDSILLSTERKKKSNLLEYSTFSEMSGKNKWLFNSEVLNSFEGGWQATNYFSEEKKGLFQLALISAALDNCNATKDGKCLKYRKNWRKKQFGGDSYLNSLEKRLHIIVDDLKEVSVPQKAIILNDDARIAIDKLPHNYKLCITSPPYLNSFDYTDIYRPELFLGKFINNSKELRELRFKTIRSHVEIKLPIPVSTNFGNVFNNVFEVIEQSNNLWNKQIPIMIQSYFEDMQNILLSLRRKIQTGGQLWLVVGNSIYAGIEIPVDLILAEIGTRNGWKLQRIEVLRNIQRRKTKHNGNLNSMRESLIVFSE